MSGKKKNRNKVKRTGTQGQGQAAPVAEKVAEVILDGEEVQNGNGEHVEHVSEVEAPQVDEVESGAEHSEIEATVEDTTNGESSANATDSHALESTPASSSTDVHTNDAAAEQSDSTAASTVDSNAHETENHTSPGQTEATVSHEENHRGDDPSPVVDPIQTTSDTSTPSSDVHHDSSAETTEPVVKAHSRQSSSSSSKSSKSSKSDLKQDVHDSSSSALVDDSQPSTNGHHSALETSDEPTEVTTEPEHTGSSISNSVRAALLADAEDDEDNFKPSHSRISSSTSDRAAPAEASHTSPGHSASGDDVKDTATSSSSYRRSAAGSSTETRTEARSTRKPISRVSSSSSSSSDASLEEFKREPATSSSVSTGPRASYKPLEPFSYNTSISDDEDDDETKKATERATERRAKAKARAATDKVEEELLDARETIQLLKKRLAKSEAETEAARDETTGVREEAAQAKLELDTLRKKHTDAVVFREESESDARKWRQRAEILQGELELVKFTEKKLAETAKALREAKDQLELEKSSRDDMETNLKAAAHDREELIHAHQRELASAKRAQEVTQAAANAQLLEEREKATEAIRFVKSKLKAQIRELELHLEDKRDNDGESRAEKRRLEREVRKLEERIELESSERAKEARSSESAKRQLELLKDRVNKLTVDKLDLETLVLQEKRKFDALNADYDRATATIRALQAQVQQNTSLAAAKAPRAASSTEGPSSDNE